MYETFSWKLEPRSLPPHPTSIFFFWIETQLLVMLVSVIPLLRVVYKPLCNLKLSKLIRIFSQSNLLTIKVAKFYIWYQIHSQVDLTLFSKYIYLEHNSVYTTSVSGIKLNNQEDYLSLSLSTNIDSNLCLSLSLFLSQNKTWVL